MEGIVGNMTIILISVIALFVVLCLLSYSTLISLGLRRIKVSKVRKTIQGPLKYEELAEYEKGSGGWYCYSKNHIPYSPTTGTVGLLNWRGCKYSLLLRMSDNDAGELERWIPENMEGRVLIPICNLRGDDKSAFSCYLSSKFGDKCPMFFESSEDAMKFKMTWGAM